MEEYSDVAQARVFLRALGEETVAVTELRDDARRLSAEARTRGDNTLALWHEQQVKVHRRTLRELSRQSENLRTRFTLTAE